jgi:hypothetical protein
MRGSLTQWITSGAANAPIELRTPLMSSFLSSSLVDTPSCKQRTPQSLHCILSNRTVLQGQLTGCDITHLECDIRIDALPLKAFISVWHRISMSVATKG